MIESAFIMPIFAEYLDNINHEKILEYTYDLKNKSDGRICSNHGGWQSNSIESRLEVFEELIDQITDRCNLFHRQMGFKSSYVHRFNNMWINVNGPGSMNHPHVHPDSVLSGVYYIKSDPAVSGKIMFLNPNAYHCNEDLIEQFTPVNSAKYFQYPEERKLLIFPSYMNHYVEPNQGREDRISISFNTSLYRVDN